MVADDCMAGQAANEVFAELEETEKGEDLELLEWLVPKEEVEQDHGHLKGVEASGE